MSFYGLNRAALNGSVSSVIAGATLVLAVGTTAAQGIRTVLPTGSITAIGQVTGSGLRTAAGDGGFIVGSAVSAFPALLQLQTANITAVSQLQATPTSAWAYTLVTNQATGFITRPGASNSVGLATVVTDPLVILGFTSNIICGSAASADASVKLSGQSTRQRDGYVQGYISSNLTGLGLKTALGYSVNGVTSSCTTDSIKIHGGKAYIDAVCVLASVPSTDAAAIIGTSLVTANGFITAHGMAIITANGTGQANQTVITYALPTVFSGTADTTASSRLALQGACNITSVNQLLNQGTVYRPGLADILANSVTEAQWALLIESSALIRSKAVLTVFPFTNAEAPDPESRTMFHTPVDRVMVRPYIDKEMRRAP